MKPVEPGDVFQRQEKGILYFIPRTGPHTVAVSPPGRDAVCRSLTRPVPPGPCSIFDPYHRSNPSLDEVLPILVREHGDGALAGAVTRGHASHAQTPEIGQDG